MSETPASSAIQTPGDGAESEASQSPYPAVATQLNNIYKVMGAFLRAAKEGECLKDRLQAVHNRVRWLIKLMNDYELLPLLTRPHNTFRLDVCKRDLAMIFVNLDKAMVWNDELKSPLPDRSSKTKRKREKTFTSLVSVLFMTKYRANIGYQHVHVCLTYHACVKENEMHEAASKQEMLHVSGVMREGEAWPQISCGGAIAHSVVYGGDVHVMDHILDYKAKINAQDKFGNTPLMMAILLNDEAMVRHLITKGAQPNIANAFGQTAIGVAICRRNKEMITFLKEHGANIRILDLLEVTPLDLAKHLEDSNILSLLQ